MKQSDAKQMIMLEALNVLEKRVRREVENIELFLQKAQTATMNTTSDKFMEGCGDVCHEAQQRIKLIEEAKKEVLSKW